MKTAYHCPLSGIPVHDESCSRRNESCFRCGWNPRVHERRVQILRYMAAVGRLYEWGKPPEQNGKGAEAGHETKP